MIRRQRPLASTLGLAGALVLAACSTAGSTWIAEPFPNDDFGSSIREEPRPPAPRGSAAVRTRVLGETPSAEAAGESAGVDSTGTASPRPAEGGRSLGTFRNTYYDFPNEAEFDGPSVRLRNAKCEVIREVPRGFFETLCVQGSGTLRTGPTVSFAKRDCSCADICPRTQQRICFDQLDAAAFPWGRGATGKAITPLLTVAVDSNVIPLGTALYVPEMDGLPRDVQGTSAHDGCFIAEDRGVKVQGKHIDVFTGHSALTAVWNRLVPSNRGVTVIVDSPRCRRN